jgi:hypothetical protein
MVAWAYLILVCFLIGTASLHGVKGDGFKRIGDRFIIAVWLGVVILSVLLLAISLVLPLSALAGAIVTVSIVALALISPRTKTEFSTLLSVLSTQWIVGFIALEVGVAAFTTQVVTHFDTGLYHFQAIRWLSRFGAVPGLALIHSRFGFTSSWFTLAAPFNIGIFEARIGSLTGGFAFLLASLHLLICFTRLLKKRGLFEDWFLVIFSFLCLPIMSWHRMQVSSSPDVPIIILTGVVAWIFIILSKRIKTEVNYIRNANLIPLILSTGAVTMKLSALPILLASGLFYIFETRLTIRRILLGGAIIFLLMLPVLVFGIITSGCPLYPSSVMCLDLPWSLGAKNAKEMSETINNWARWSGQPPATANSWNWLGHWIEAERPAAFLLIYSILSTIGLTRLSNNNQVRGQGYVLALGELGVLFMMYSAPSLRFGLGYLCLLPAWLMAVYCNTQSPFMARVALVISGLTICWLGLSKIGLPILAATLIVYLVIWFYRHKLTDKVFIIVLLVFIGIIPLKRYIDVSRKDIPNNQQRLLVPPKMQMPNQSELLNKQINDIKYIAVDLTLGNHQCWAVELPCTPSLAYENIKLRIPERGIGAGFVRN